MRDSARRVRRGCRPAESKIILLLAAVSFVTSWISCGPAAGPDLAKEWESTLASGSRWQIKRRRGGGGLGGALFLDRFDRRSALAVAMLAGDRDAAGG